MIFGYQPALVIQLLKLLKNFIPVDIALTGGKMLVFLACIIMDMDMAQAVNRIKELNGGIVVCAGGKILSEIALPIGGVISELPMETLAEKLNHIQQAATNLGCTLSDVRISLGTLTTAAIPFLRICEEGLVDLRQNKFVDLIVD